MVRSTKLLTALLATALGAALCRPAPAPAAGTVRVKDITRVEGERTNVLVGLGLVTGLQGTGGKNPITREFVLNLAQRFGIRSEPDLIAKLRNDTSDKSDNTSVVVVMAELTTGRKKGEKIDITISAMDDAKSLNGGVLLPTPLVAVDGQVYALASGEVSTGAFSFSGEAASVQKNHPTTGRIASGATVEKETFAQVGLDGRLRLILLNPDYETARRIAGAANKQFPGVAEVIDSGSILLTSPPEWISRTRELASDVQQLLVIPDYPAKVVVNERTGTIIVGENVRLSRVLVNHANLAIMTGETPEVSQPAPFSNGETTVVPRTQVDVVEERNPIVLLDEPATVADLAQALNALGVSPRDLSSIFQHLKVAGALHAELELK